MPVCPWRIGLSLSRARGISWACRWRAQHGSQGGDDPNGGHLVSVQAVQNSIIQKQTACSARPAGWPLRVAHRATLCSPVRQALIQSFRHKGLKRFYETGSTAGIQAAHAKKLRIRLAALDTATVIEDKGRWAISVNGNWRLTFEFRDGNAFVLDYEDYH